METRYVSERVRINQFSSEKDIDKVVDLFIRVMAEPPHKENWTKDLAIKSLKNFFKNSDGFCFYVQDNTSIIGFVFCIVQTWDDGDHLFIEQIVINPFYRGKGIGIDLINKLEKRARERGIKAIDLMATKEFQIDKFWKKRGYMSKAYELFSKELN